MIDTPKRRGRPPKVKPIEIPPPRLEIESWTMAQGTKMVFAFKAAMSTPTTDREVFLPPGWPIPQLNDTVRVGGLAGRVQYVEYDYDTGTIKVTCA